MLTISYASITAAIVAAAAMGATGSAWVLCGALVENRALANRLHRFESRSGQLSRRGSRAMPPAAWPWDVRSTIAGTSRTSSTSRRQHVGAHRLDAWTGPTPPRRPVLAYEGTIVTHRPPGLRRLAITAG